MEFPIDPEFLLAPKLNQRNPHELHWREPPPECNGSMKRTCGKLYPHLVEHFCCMQCGAIPCPFDHETEKHIRIKDMEFVRELVKEKKELENELKKMQAEINDFEQLKKEWERDKTVLEGEITRLHQLNSKHQDQLKEFRENLRKIMSLTQENAELKDNNIKLTDDNDKYKKMLINQSNEMAKLELKYKSMYGELDGVKLELHKTVSQLKDAVENMMTMKQKMHENDLDMKKMKQDMQNMLKEMEEKTKQFEIKEFELNHVILTLQDQVEDLEHNLSASRQDNADLRRLVAELQAEIERLRQKLAKDKRFKQFVAIKREVNEVKGINDVLYSKVCEHPEHIPVMKRSGKVSMNRTVTEPIPKLRRPKSAMLKLRAWEGDFSQTTGGSD